LRRGEGPRIHRKRVFALSMDCRVKPGNDESAKTVSLHTRFGEARRTRGLRTLAQVEPPGRGEAGRVESEINDQRELRAAGERDRLAEPQRNQEAADRTDCADETDRRAALDRSRLQRQRPRRLALAARLAQVLL